MGRDGYLQFPEEVIKIWADNGFGAMVHSFLLAGQSNMAGRGFLNEVPPIHKESAK